ncbi:YwmB family TATA-box binding protein [Bacillus sp. 179-C3.3 HS]|uniref:YwmB family TATA-box binding protein n=1 Tax=Bacillus sp. 179-C3.3 HS TaxID=3232162 RepID=UPI0039A1E9F6
MRKCLKGWPMIAFILFFVLIIQGVRAEELSPLDHIAEGFKEQGVQVDGWTLHAKTNVDLTSKQFSKKVKRLKAELRQYEWTEKKEKHVTKVTGLYRNEKNDTFSKIILVKTDTKSKQKSYLLYEQKGSHPLNTWKHTYDQFVRHAKSILQEKFMIFTCLDGHVNGMMNVVLQKKAEMIANEFQAKPVEYLVESNFVSISAYTDKWEQFIMTSNEKMNVQIAIRSSGMNKKHTITVGTPIVTTEY